MKTLRDYRECPNQQIKNRPFRLQCLLVSVVFGASKLATDNFRPALDVNMRALHVSGPPARSA